MGVLPVTASARAIGLAIGMVPSAQGGLFVSVPAGGGAVVVALLDPGGSPQPGWPIALPGATTCGDLLPASDGSIRIVCTPSDLNLELGSGVRAYAFDGSGRPLAGWPVDIDGMFTSARLIGDDLAVFTVRSLGDVEVEGQPTADAGLVTVAVDGRIASGVRVTEFYDCCNWELGRDGVAYSATLTSESDDGTELASEIMAVDASGARIGWPIGFADVPSRPTFGPDGRVVLAAGSVALGTTRVLSFEARGTGIAASSSALRLATVTPGWHDTGGCSATSPRPPVVAADGTIFVFSEEDTPVVAVTPSLELLPGWPVEPTAPIQRRDEREVIEDAYCPFVAVPAAGADGTLYLPLMAAEATAGGQLSALAPDGRVRSGWPVTLTRAGAEFWSVAVGTDGTIYAMAIEPEVGGGSSATILAIAPDSNVLYSTTIVEP